MKTCSVDGCDRPFVAKGCCQMHYIRLYRKGEVGGSGPMKNLLAQKYPIEHRAWRSAISRCNNKGTVNYADYGGRGIKICDRWLGPDGFAHFLEDMGPRPEGEYPSGKPRYSLDRIDVNGNYCPENCRWATMIEQTRNRRTTIRLEIGGEVKSLQEWCKIKGAKYTTVRQRMLLGWDKADLFRPSTIMKYNDSRYEKYIKPL